VNRFPGTRNLARFDLVAAAAGIAVQIAALFAMAEEKRYQPIRQYSPVDKSTALSLRYGHLELGKTSLEAMCISAVTVVYPAGVQEGKSDG
jgi:hypothetical protein